MRFGRRGVSEDSISPVHVPGAWSYCSRSKSWLKVASSMPSGSWAAIRGSTPHFDYVAGEAAKGAAMVMTQTGVPISFGVLTTDTIEQAAERAGTKAGNKGGEAVGGRGNGQLTQRVAVG